LPAIRLVGNRLLFSEAALDRAIESRSTAAKRR
jgi:hypothetical protein